VLGLGNPGAEYEGTRHNVGYVVVERVAERLGRPFLRRGRSAVARAERDGRVLVLAKPLTYMNRSGRAAADLLDELLPPVDLLVICDDFNLPLGRLRCRLKGSAGGQKGLDSILERLGHTDVPRLRIGIGEPGRMPAEDYVLKPFKRSEQAPMDEALERAATSVLDWWEHGDSRRLVEACNAPPL
jgi:PTH1 family peptidyl-tRNA hydrolase